MTRDSKTLAAALLAGLALTTAAWAQFGAGTRGPASGRPLRTERLPFAAGIVSGVDSAAGTLTLAPLFGSAAQIVRVTATTQITAQTAGKVEDLKVGDTVQVQGVPTGITASQVTAGESLDQPLSFPSGMGRPGASGGRLKPSGPQAAFAQAAGKITALTPLTVSVSDTVQVALKMAPDAKISRNAAVTLTDVKVGDRILANGQPGEDGTLTAALIRVNADNGFGKR